MFIILIIICGDLIEKDDEDPIYLGIGLDKLDMSFTGSSADLSNYVHVGTEKILGSGGREVVMLIDRRGYGLFFCLQPIRGRVGYYRRIQLNYESFIQLPIALAVLRWEGLMAPVRSAASREQLKEY